MILRTDGEIITDLIFEYKQKMLTMYIKFNGKSMILLWHKTDVHNCDRETIASWVALFQHIAGLILDLRSANKRRRYFVTVPLIGWAQA